MNKNTNSSARIDDFFPSRGHRIFTPTFQLPEFRMHVANMTPADREHYSPLSSSGVPTDGGEYFFVGLHRTREEVRNLLVHVIIDDC
jgi:hypothetical protein